MFENTNIKTEITDSPDSGHREMSSDSLSYNFNQLDVNSWQKSNTTKKNPFDSSMNQKANEPPSSFGSPFKLKMVLPAPSRPSEKREFGIAPKLDPPPRIRRERSRSPKTTFDSASSGLDQNRNSYSSSGGSTDAQHSPFYKCKFQQPLTGTLSDPSSQKSTNLAANLINCSGEEAKVGSKVVDIRTISSRHPHPSPTALARTEPPKTKLDLSFSDDDNAAQNGFACAGFADSFVPPPAAPGPGGASSTGGAFNTG